MPDDNEDKLLDRLLRLLGMNPVQVRWRWRGRWQRFLNLFRKAENRSRVMTYEHKACPSCGAPADKNDSTCNRCGSALQGQTANRAGKVMALLVPEGATVYTTFIGVTIIAIFAAMLAQGGLAMLWPRGESAMLQQRLLSLQLGAGHVWYYDLDRLGTVLKAIEQPGWIPEYPHVWRLVTAAFVHFGAWHILFNFYALMSVGPTMEEVYGRSRFLLIYFLCAVGGNIASQYWYWDQQSWIRTQGQALLYGSTGAGASGAVFGLIGASLVYGWRSGTTFGRNLASEMLKWAVFAMLFAVLVKADHAAHIGGFLMGGLLTLVIPDERTPSRIPNRVWGLAELAILLLIIGSFVALFTVHDPVYDFEVVSRARAQELHPYIRLVID